MPARKVPTTPRRPGSGGRGRTSGRTRATSGVSSTDEPVWSSGSGSGQRGASQAAADAGVRARGKSKLADEGAMGAGSNGRGRAGQGASKRKRGVPHPVAWAAVVFAITASAIIFSNIRCAAVPEPRAASSTPATEFSAERAMRHVKVLAEDIGHRVVGSHNNEVLAKEYLIKEIQALKSAADANGWNLELSVQDATGTLSFSFLFSFFSNVYSNVTNIVVRVSPADLAPEAMEHALLVSSHYDSTLGTPGAADDAVAIAVMVESVNNLVHSKPTLPHPIIFNFNGAEESFLQAAHGFITLHEWAKTVDAFVNLEGAGSGGPEILFQTGPHQSWLSRVYAEHCPYPHGSAAAQDVFQSNLYPGDTDFRIYRDFGPHGGKDGSESGAPGFDMAFYHNGHVYHTARDSYDNVDPGSVQHMGSNVHALIRGVVTAPEFGTPREADDGAVFADVFGYFTLLMMQPTAMTAYACLVGALGLTIVLLRPVPGDASVGAQVGAALVGSLEFLACFVGSFIGAMVAAGIFSAAHISMSWYARPGLIVLMYGAPSLGAMMTAQYATTYFCGRASSFSRRRARSQLGQAAMWAVLTALFASKGLGSAHIPFVYGSFALAGLVVSAVMGRMMPRQKSLTWVLSTVIGAWGPTAHGNYLSSVLGQATVPVVGKAGALPTFAGEAIVAGVCALGTVLVFHSLLPALHSLASKHRATLRRSMITVWIVGVVFAFITHPYSHARPKRMIVYHLHTFESAALTAPGAPTAHTIADSSMLLSRFDPSPQSIYINGFVAGARNLKQGHLTLGQPEEIVDHKRWQAYHPFSSFLDGVQWRDMPPHGAYLDPATTPSVTLVADDRFAGADAPAPTHEVSPEYLAHHGVAAADVRLSRRVQLGVFVPQKCWSTLNITTSNMVGWSFSSVLPELTCEDGSALASTAFDAATHHQHCSYMARHAGNTDAFDFWLEFTQPAPVTITLATVCVPAHGPPSPAVELFEQASPDWISPTMSYGTIQQYTLQA